MNPDHTEPIRLLFTITARGNGRKWIAALKQHGIYHHIQFSGKGTASSEMLDILGLEDINKSLLLSFGSKKAVDRLAEKMSESFRKTIPVKGITMILAPTAVNQLIAVMAARFSENIESKGSPETMKNEFNYSIILVAVNQGYTDSVMQTAKKAGATGGTVIRARIADADQSEHFYGIALQEEREIVAIMTPGSTRDAIMEAINTEFGMRTDAQAILLSLPVEKVFKIS